MASFLIRYQAYRIDLCQLESAPWLECRSFQRLQNRRRTQREPNEAFGPERVTAYPEIITWGSNVLGTMSKAIQDARFPLLLGGAIRLYCRQELAYVAAEGRADALECGVEARGKCLDAGGSAEGDQSNEQDVFDQVLTLFAAGQVLKPYI